MGSDENPFITVWITKWALTQGIIKREAEHCVNISERMIAYIQGDSVLGMRMTVHKPYWYTTEKEALQHMVVLLKKRTAALSREQLKLDKLYRETLAKLGVHRNEPPRKML